MSDIQDTTFGTSDEVFQIAGFASIANSGNPANGTGLLSSATVERWKGGNWVVSFTLNSIVQRIIVEDNPKWNALFNIILRGTNGFSSGYTTQTMNGVVTTDTTHRLDDINVGS